MKLISSFASLYMALWLSVVFTMLWTLSCVYGWNPPIDPIEPPEPPEELQAIDSCAVMDIDTPAVRCITVVDATREIAEQATISWRQTGQIWIDNFAVVDSSHIKILIDIVGENMGFDSANWIDKSVIDANMIHLDFTVCFYRPIGVFELVGEDGIYFDFRPSTIARVNDRILVRKDKVGSIYPPDESTAEEMIQLIPASYQLLGFYGIELDSAGMVPVWMHGLSNCKGFAKWDGRGHSISAEILEQASYQQITVIQ